MSRTWHEHGTNICPDVILTLHITVPNIDDVPLKGPKPQYQHKNGYYETIPEHSGIRRVIQRMKYCGGTFSGYNAFLCTREITVLGHRCTPEVIPRESFGNTAFLRIIRVARIFIKNFAKKAFPLNMLTRSGVAFVFGPEQIKAMEELKDALFNRGN
jgi:hypothetical protein